MKQPKILMVEMFCYRNRINLLIEVKKKIYFINFIFGKWEIETRKKKSEGEKQNIINR